MQKTLAQRKLQFALKGIKGHIFIWSNLTYQLYLPFCWWLIHFKRLFWFKTVVQINCIILFYRWLLNDEGFLSAPTLVARSVGNICEPKGFDSLHSITYCVTSQRSWWLTIHPRESIACPLVPILSRLSWAWATWRVSRHVTWCVLVTVSQLSVSLDFTCEGCIHTNHPGRTYHWQYLLSLLSRPVITRASLEVMCRNISSLFEQHRKLSLYYLLTPVGESLGASGCYAMLSRIFPPRPLRAFWASVWRVSCLPLFAQ